jgi:hypothetical protein
VILPVPVYEKTFDSEIKRLSEKYKVEEKTARAIIWCESRNISTAVNRQAVVGIDVGYWQLNTYFWEVEMRNRGWNIYDKWDNLEAGFWLVSVSGLKPWKWSEPCWSKVLYETR